MVTESPEEAHAGCVGVWRPVVLDKLLPSDTQEGDEGFMED